VADNIDSVQRRKEQIKSTFDINTNDLKNRVADTVDLTKIINVLTEAKKLFEKDNNFQNVFSNSAKEKKIQGAGFTLALQIALKKL
jgi:hypothetical protein